MKKNYLLTLPILALTLTGILVGCSKVKNIAEAIRGEASLDEKIGQMVMVGFRGLAVDEDSKIVQDVKELQIGGVILFDVDFLKTVNEEGEETVDVIQKRNIESPRQVKALVDALQEKSKVPLFIAIDQEGGQVARLKEKHGFPKTLSAQELGQLDDTDKTYQEAAKIAETLKSIGINVNLAPVVDLNTNLENPIIGKKQRSFSTDPEVVTRHATAFIKAHHAQGILCSPKHFPGHGSSREDSHLGMVDVTDTWSPDELTPYTNLINEGLVDMIMTAHIFNEYLDPYLPATLSKDTITDLLRTHLKYDGVVITDDIQMKAITDNYGKDESVKRALEAGVDIIIIANTLGYDPDAAKHTINLIKNLVKDGSIDEARIDISYQRIMNLKEKLKR